MSVPLQPVPHCFLRLFYEKFLENFENKIFQSVAPPMATASEKPLISISVIGHVDSGKSTLTGRLATVWGGFDSRAQEKLAKVAAENKKESFTLAYFTDKTKQERDRGVTINTTLVEMETSKFRINFLDCPGHADYIKNATNGCKQSDLSIVVVPADFQASCSNEGTLSTHMTLAAMLGSKNFIICINKLDEVAARNSSDVSTTFDAAVAAVESLMRKKLGLRKKDVIFLPISALKGVGVFEGGETFPFFKGWAKPKVGKNAESQPDVIVNTLEGAINSQDPPSRPVDSPLRLPISSLARVPGQSGAILCGRIDYGCLKPGDVVRFLPANFTCEVKSIQAHKKDVPEGIAGMNIGFAVIYKDTKVALTDRVKAGSLVGPSNDPKFQAYPFYVAECISMKPKSTSSAEERGIRAGYTPVIACGTSSVACKFVKLISSRYKDEAPVESPVFISKDHRFTALLYPTKLCLFEPVTAFPALAKFVCRDSGILVTVGNIVKCLTEEEAKEQYGVTLAMAKGEKTAESKAKKAAK